MALGSGLEKQATFENSSQMLMFLLTVCASIGQRGFVSEPFIFSCSSSSQLSMACPWLG